MKRCSCVGIWRNKRLKGSLKRGDFPVSGCLLAVGRALMPDNPARNVGHQCPTYCYPCGTLGSEELRMSLNGLI